MTRDGLHILGWAFAAFLFHLMSFSTPYGMVRFELPFFLAYVYASRGFGPWISGMTFFVPSLVFDVLDNQFAGSLAHLLIFLLMCRLKSVLNFGKPSGCLFWGLTLAVLDRASYGFLAGWKMEPMSGTSALGASETLTRMGSDLVVSSILSPAYLLTVLLLPIAFLRPRL